MEQYIPLLITNAGQSNRENFYRFIEMNSSGIQTYWIDPDRVRAKGGIIGAAFDYTILIEPVSTIANLIAIADLLWNAYKRFFGKDQSARLYISLPDGTTFGLGEEERDRDIFIRNFTTRVIELQQHPKAIAKKTTEIITEIQNSDIWVRRK